ncbi:RMND5A [Bugula neritina]|uniref:RMND5A n=1 Tax=Bugula neritina TaxID=10212 RepID=A0A7J7KBZ6_BUGNE|nr:RMND5A [Bugula neritina]
MCCFIYQHKGIENSPYAHFVSNDSWQKLEDQFTKDACSLVGLPLESPLAISVNAGAQTLGPLLQITKVMSQKQLSLDWTPKEELPIAVELGHAARFHSVFACPILRRHANDNNPPMKLTCGHVISKDALNQLFHGPKLKCPYCPAEQTLTETMRLHI